MRLNPSKTVDELITVLTYIIDLDDNKEIFHSWKVAILAAVFANKLVPPAKRRHIFYAGLFHDVGGVGYPFHIIHYLTRPTPSNINILLTHPLIGAQLISSLPQMNQAAKMILDHHEWLNGQGYPKAKTGSMIPLGSQLVRIADSWDILLQMGRIKTLGAVKARLSRHVDKEFSARIFGHALKEISLRPRFFQRLRQSRQIPEIFRSLKDEVGRMRIPENIDAIGRTLEVFAEIIDMKHPFTAGHSTRVSRYALAIALAMKLNHDEVTKIKWAGLIHDIGKINVSRHVLNKRTKLGSKEYREVKKHARFTGDILNLIPSLQEITPIAANHHEHFDGSGYPRGLRGEQIPIGARIVSACDAFDAMTANRPYRIPLAPRSACREIKRCSGTHFDPKVVRVALPLFCNLSL